MFINMDKENTYNQKRKIQMVAMIYFAFFLDNMLLTVIVPILPDYLVQKAVENGTVHQDSKKGFPDQIKPGTTNLSAGLTINYWTIRPSGQDSFQLNRQYILQDENELIGMLLATKAFVQLVFNPLVGTLSTSVGNSLPMLCGTFCLLMATFIFLCSEVYVSLIFARGLQGVGSACISVCGMSLVAQLYPEEGKRTQVMGFVLGSVALGVLIGYPFGGILYDFAGKASPFYLLFAALSFHIVFQFVVMDFKAVSQEFLANTNRSWKNLLQMEMVPTIMVAICISTSVMAVLEPCLPIWLMENVQPEKWQLGLVFVPDSLGYFIGTNFFGTVAYEMGQIKASCISFLVIGISCVIIPTTTSVYGLILPHFGIGLGIGVVDVALVPLLASFVDGNSNKLLATGNSIQPNYGVVYAVQQTSVSLAYSLAPLVGGAIAQKIGFGFLIRTLGFANLLYAPTLAIVSLKFAHKSLRNNNHIALTNFNNFESGSYQRLQEALD